MRKVSKFKDRQGKDRKGNLLVLTAFLMVIMVGMLAFSIDLGYMYTMQTQLDRATDAAALAAAGALIEGEDAARQRAIEYLVRNPVGGGQVAVDETQLSQMMLEFEQDYDDELDLELGHWNSETHQIESAASAPSTISIHMRYANMPMFFGKIFGRDDFAVESTAIARYQPRDISVVLDLSGSMNNDSEFGAISSLGQTAVEQNLFQIYQDLGSPTYGGMQWEPQYISSTNSTTIKSTLGISSVPYPYPGGSWNSYINWAKSYGTTNSSAGYRKRYGYKNLVNYWLEKQEAADETPDLWMASAQPITAVKDAVELFTDYVGEIDTNDRLALAVYNASNGNGLLEVSLTEDLDQIGIVARQRQAGHYHSYTNIGAGLDAGLDELESNGRGGAFKMLVLMTDGNANWYNGNYTTSGARNYVLSQAQRAAALKIPVVTISLGAGADTSIMEQVAEITDGHHFQIPGGQSVAAYSADLVDVFRIIADARPLTLVD